MENNNYEKIKLVINALNDEVLKKNPSCIIKYEAENNAPEYEFKNDFEINENVSDNNGNKTEGENEHTVEISLKPPTLKSGDKEISIEYLAYICDSIITDIDNLHPMFLKGKEGCEEFKVTENKIKFTKMEGKEYSISVQATVKNGNKEEVFIYQKLLRNSETENDKPNNDLIFYIIMGSFAFIIIFVFILIFYIINQRKKNNPDIDDEDFNKIPVLRETINEDES
jgi:hypothetical protein